MGGGLLVCMKDQLVCYIGDTTQPRESVGIVGQWIFGDGIDAFNKL